MTVIDPAEALAGVSPELRKVLEPITLCGVDSAARNAALDHRRKAHR